MAAAKPGAERQRPDAVAVEGSGPDSTSLHRAARSGQAAFERTRIRFSPMGWGTPYGPCDEVIGRFCLRFGSRSLDETDPEAWTPPPEPARVTEARLELLDLLSRVGEAIPGDGWILGQRLAYLGEAGRWDEARALARGCDTVLTETWWCDALEGFVHHSTGAFVASERAFAAAMSAMPPPLAEGWRDLDALLPHELRRRFREATEEERIALEAQVWTLADPLFLVPGNDRRSEHLARHTLARIRSDARNPYGMRWGDDLAELLVRYGTEVAFEQQRASPLPMGPPPVVGRLNPSSRGLFPTPPYFLAPSEIPVDQWRVEERATRERYAPAYAPRIGGLEVQQARFRRGDELLLVLGWKTHESDRGGNELEVGAFLRSVPDLAPLEVDPWVRAPVALDRGDGWGAAARVPAGGYLVSVELLDVEGRRAWRARHGLEFEVPPRGVVSVSDLLLLDPEEDGGGRIRPSGQADGLEASLGRILPSRRLAHRQVDVAWEVYGLSDEAETIRFRVAATPEGESILARTARFLRLLPSPARVELAWDEVAPEPTSGPDETLFRFVTMDLSSLPTGPTRLMLTVEVPGRTPTRSEVVVELPP